MEKKSKQRKEVYHSMAEFEKKFFPDSYKKNLEGKSEKPGSLGTGLATELLRSIKQQLAK